MGSREVQQAPCRDDGLAPPNVPVLRAKAGKAAKTPTYRPPARTP